jgi:rRNA-processing protein FCF1
MKEIRSVSFDTSFLLKDDPDVDRVIKELKRDRIPCYVTSTVISELEQLKIWNRIDERTYKKAMSRWKRVNARIIDFKNRFLSSEFGKQCVVSMEMHHGVKPEDILNDCNILVVSLKNGIDLFLSEDFHFTSKVTEDVLEDITNNACVEYHQMCDEELYAIDNKTFLKAYKKGRIDLKVIDFHRQDIKKPGKRIGKEMG